MLAEEENPQRTHVATSGDRKALKLLLFLVLLIPHTTNLNVLVDLFCVKKPAVASKLPGSFVSGQPESFGMRLRVYLSREG